MEREKRGREADIERKKERGKERAREIETERHGDIATGERRERKKRVGRRETD